MNQPPPLPAYRTPSAGPPPRRGGAGWFFLGLFAGLAVSCVAWVLLVKAGANSSNAGALFLWGLVLIPAIKITSGILIARRSDRKTFLPGILSSIALAPLIGFGLLFAACAGAFR